jgi:hypothetical protein
MNYRRNGVFSTILVLILVLIGVTVAEVILRIKTSMTSYDIEMWRYAKKLTYKALVARFNQFETI